MSGKYGESVRRKLTHVLFEYRRRSTMAPPRALRWYPHELAYQLDIPKDA